MEIWKPVVGYEGLYEISNLGKVKSLNYNNTNKQKTLKNSTSQGYDRVCLSINKIGKFHRDLGIDQGNISKCCNGIQKFARGFIWKLK